MDRDLLNEAQEGAIKADFHSNYESAQKRVQENIQGANMSNS